MTLVRQVAGGVYSARSAEAQTEVGPGNWYDTDIVFPAPTNATVESFYVQAVEQSDLAGSTVTYQRSVSYESVVPLGAMIDVSAAQQPLAGGLATFTVTIYNRGYADMDLLVIQNGGVDPGDLYISVLNPLGQEVGRTLYKGTPSGTFFTSDGRGFLRVPAGGSKSFDVPNVLVSEALGTNVTQFLAVAPRVFYHLGGADEAMAGPLSGAMQSSLAVTPYYGTAQTDKPLYANEDIVHISGQAIDRQSGQPQPNAPLKLGFFSRGYQFYYDVTSDGDGNYTYDWNPPPGLSGSFTIWAAHPDVFDVLNQAQFSIYRCYLSPSAPDIRMSKNDVLNFSVTLVNPGDNDLTDFSLESHTYQVVGTNKTEISTITATSLNVTNFSIGPRSSQKVSFQLSAALDAPDNAEVDLKFRSAEGAAADCNVNLALLPANPLLTVVDPAVGYAEVSVNRGDIASRTVTMVNNGLRDLKGVTIQPPTNYTWMQLNLPVSADGLIHLPDWPVGGTNVFTAVFAPPVETPLDYLNDFVTIRGTNTPATFKVNLYALVTSSQKGKVHFHVDDILVEPVPNATVRIKNTILEQEYTLTTDANGEAEIDDLQEGAWAWQASAPGHSANVGVVTVIANQIVSVDTRLSRSLVTVSFTVTPVPFTDRYEITIEQTFETHVPAPVMIFTPAVMDFNDIDDGFEATYIATLKNEGLIDAVDVQVVGSVIPEARLVPLINYLPVLHAQQSVDIPMQFKFFGLNPNSSSASVKTPCGRPKCFGYDIDPNTGQVTPQPGLSILQNYNDFKKYPCTGGAFDLSHFLGALNAIADACAVCADLKTAMHLLTGTISHFKKKIVSPISSGVMNAAKVVDLLGGLFGCPGASGGGGGPGGGGSSGPASSDSRGFTSYNGGGAGCFAEGTLVLMGDGTWKRIEKVQAHDVVRTGPTKREFAHVAQVQARQVTKLYEVKIAAMIPMAATQETSFDSVTATPEHEFWVDGRGWTAVAQLQPGDWLFTPEGDRVQVKSITRLDKATRVYTLANLEDHAFYANGLLVRDSCGNRWPVIGPPDTAGFHLTQPSTAEVSQ